MAFRRQIISFSPKKSYPWSRFMRSLLLLCGNFTFHTHFFTRLGKEATFSKCKQTHLRLPGGACGDGRRVSQLGWSRPSQHNSAEQPVKKQNSHCFINCLSFLGKKEKLQRVQIKVWKSLFAQLLKEEEELQFSDEWCLTFWLQLSFFAPLSHCSQSKAVLLLENYHNRRSPTAYANPVSKILIEALDTHIA